MSGQSSTTSRPRILHCFADFGTEAEVLTGYGEVIRIGIQIRDTNDSTPIQADAHIKPEGESKAWDIPFKEEVQFDLGVFHPVCSRWAATTSISGDPDRHENMIPSSRSIAERFCDHYVIENVPEAPLNDPTVLEGRMFGLPIKYERAFETTFPVKQPPRHKRFWNDEGAEQTAETSSFFFSERSREWWASAKNYRPGPYPKQHLAKNTIPAPYIHYICRAWLTQYEVEKGLTEGRVDYSNYDEEMETMRRRKKNTRLDQF